MLPEEIGVNIPEDTTPAEGVNSLGAEVAEEAAAPNPKEEVNAMPEQPAQQPLEKFVPEAPVACEQPTRPEEEKKEKKEKKRKKRPHILLRALFQFFSFVLCLVLFVAIFATALVADVRQLTSAGGIQQIVQSLVGGTGSETQPAAEYVPAPTLPGASYGYVPLSDYEFDVDDVPEDILSGGNGEDNMDALFDWVFEMIEENMGEEVDFTAEDFQEFLEESTVTDYVSDKLAGFAEDFINGTENTNITTEEIMALLEENAPLLEEKLNIVLTEEEKTQIRQEFDKIVVEQDINNTIRDTVNSAVEETLQGSVGVDMEQVHAFLQLLVSDMVLYILLGICLILVLLLCLLNYYNVGAGFTWSASAGMLAGTLLSAPLLVVRYAGETITQMLPEFGSVLGAVRSFLTLFETVHYGVLIGSTVVFVLSIVWRIIAFCRRRAA